MHILCILNCVQSFLFVLAFRLRQSKMFNASYDGLHLSTQKVQVGKDQEKAQSEKDSHSKIQTNNQVLIP